MVREMTHSRKQSERGKVEIISKVFIITHNGKKYYLLDYPQGRFLLTQSEYHQSEVNLKKGMDIFSVKMDYPTRDKSYYRFLDYFDTKPTFRKKINKLEVK
jgi:hypothetical protein